MPGFSERLEDMLAEQLARSGSGTLSAEIAEPVPTLADRPAVSPRTVANFGATAEMLAKTDTKPLPVITPEQIEGGL
jgi:hypothetical protein